MLAVAGAFVSSPMDIVVRLTVTGMTVTGMTSGMPPVTVAR